MNSLNFYLRRKTTNGNTKVSSYRSKQKHEGVLVPKQTETRRCVRTEANGNTKVCSYRSKRKHEGVFVPQQTETRRCVRTAANGITKVCSYRSKPSPLSNVPIPHALDPYHQALSLLTSGRHSQCLSNNSKD
jgi:hypothetical protein